MSQIKAIPPAVWEKDKDIWRAWIEQLDANMTTIAQYKRVVAEFCWAYDASIQECTERQIAEYELVERALLSKTKADRDMRIIRAYWTFAKQQASAKPQP